MGAISHRNKFIRELKGFPHEKASFSALADALGADWTPEKVEKRARRFDEDVASSICVVKHGVQYFGCETGTKPGLYKEIRRGIERRWGSDNSMRKIEVRHTSRTAVRGSGTWTQPDLVARVIRKSTAKPRIVYLAIEAEQAGGFDMASVYQAYEFGRGADFSWVFYAGPRCKPAKFERIETAARDLRVGIVHAAKPTAPAAWNTIVPARIRPHTKKAHADFLRRSGLTIDSFSDT